MKTALILALLMAGCSSSSGSAGVCQPNGTFMVTGSVLNGNCAYSTESITDTFSTESGLLVLRIQGLPDYQCPGKLDSATCKWTAACTAKVTDATSASNNEATLQYSYTFSEHGLTGTYSTSIPPSKSVPAGCSGAEKVTGTRL